MVKKLHSSIPTGRLRYKIIGFGVTVLQQEFINSYYFVEEENPNHSTLPSSNNDEYIWVNVPTVGEND